MQANNRRIYTLFLLPCLVLITFISCKNNKESANNAKGGKPKGLRAEGYVIIQQSFQKDFNASGSLRPNEELEIHPEISGRITSINFKEGGNVGKGQTLIQLSDADIRAQIQKLRSQRALQQKLLERQEDLVRIGGISRQEYETTQTGIASINADLAFQEAQLRKTRIVAPFSGRIGLREVSLGAIVSPTSVVATLQQVHPLKMDFTVPDQYRNSLSQGKVIFFEIEGQEPLSGKITAIEPGADPSTRSVRVRASVPNTGNKLAPGTFAHVTIPFESSANTMLVPSQAVIPTTRDKKVAIVRKGKAELVVVELGTRTNDKVEVISGLVPGDTVITTGIMQVKPGMDVTITKLKT
ncbi:MAG: efflux RND transporter periplasmic adaptor subunit [Sphingobacteriales bacterium]|nr:MAG: efflux RND transporter periplasmic adaptor subunit [Sphingobacteriales bacterium]